MHHAAGGGGQLRDRHAQLLGAGLQQHGAGQDAKTAHYWVTHAHRHTAAGDAHAVFHHHIGIARWRGLDDEGGGVGVQFFTDNLRHGGVGALAAFHKGAEQAHRAVRANLQKRRHLRAAFRRVGGGREGAAATQRQAETNHQCTYGGAGQKTPARQVDRVAQGHIQQFVARTHQTRSFCWAKSCMAVWMAL